MTEQATERERFADDEALDAEGLSSWCKVPARASLGHWLVIASESSTLALIPPGVTLSERWDSEDLLFWREAMWQGQTADQDGGLRAVRRLSSLAEALDVLQGSAAADTCPRDITDWMVEVTRQHADGLDRLVRLQRAQPGPGVTEHLGSLVNRIADHRRDSEQAARRLAKMRMAGQTSRELATLVEAEPDGLLARVEREVESNNELGDLAFVLAGLEKEFGDESIRSALLSLLFAKQHSTSWRISGYVRENRRRTRRAKRAVLRAVRAFLDEHTALLARD